MRKETEQWDFDNNRFSKFTRTKTGNLSVRILRVLFPVAIIIWLGFKLYEIGWKEVLGHLPAEPLFYLIFPLFYLVTALADMIVYRKTWEFNLARSIPAFIKKWVLNSEVIAYSGEVYFFSRIQKKLNKSKKEIAEKIRDYNILSAAGSYTVSILYLAGFIYFSQADISRLLGELEFYNYNILVFGLLFILLIIIVVIFRKYLFATSLRMSLFVMHVHVWRFTIYLGLQMALWASVMPEVPVSIWLTYTAVAIIVTRIPVSNKQLIFLGVGVEISGGLALSEAAIFGLFGAIAALEKIFSFLLYVCFTAIDKYLDKKEKEEKGTSMVVAGVDPVMYDNK